MANQGQKLISSWINERCKELGGPIRGDGSEVVEFIRRTIRDLRVLAHVRVVAHQPREEDMTLLDELIVECKRWEELPALFAIGLKPVRRAA